MHLLFHIWMLQNQSKYHTCTCIRVPIRSITIRLISFIKNMHLWFQLWFSYIIFLAIVLIIDILHFWQSLRIHNLFYKRIQIKVKDVYRPYAYVNYIDIICQRKLTIVEFSLFIPVHSLHPIKPLNFINKMNKFLL